MPTDVNCVHTKPKILEGGEHQSAQCCKRSRSVSRVPYQLHAVAADAPLEVMCQLSSVLNTGEARMNLPGSHRKRIDFCLIDPRDHAPSTPVENQLLATFCL
jgi:hypothetical protein